MLSISEKTSFFKMKIFALFAVTIFWNFEGTTEQYFKPSKNTVTLEKMICKTFPGSKVTLFNCSAKYIDRNHLKVQMSLNISEPIYDMWLNIEPYYKFRRYTRIAGYIWENLCDWLAGKRTSFILNYYGPWLKDNIYFNRTCPLLGYFTLKVDNISMQEFAFPEILPAGRYYEDIYVTESYGSKSKALYNFKLYNTVSDHRIEVV